MISSTLLPRRAIDIATSAQMITGDTVSAPTTLTADFQGQGKTFAPRVAVHDDPGPMDRPVALCGRDPRWAPPAPAG